MHYRGQRREIYIHFQFRIMVEQREKNISGSERTLSNCNNFVINFLNLIPFVYILTKHGHMLSNGVCYKQRGSQASR